MVYTPDTVLAEVARKFVREGIDVNTVNEWLSEIVGASSIICLDIKLAIDAAQCSIDGSKCQKIKVKSSKFI